MELVLLTIADRIDLRSDGRMNLEGAAPEWINVDDLALPVVLPLAVVLSLDDAERNESVEIELRISSDAAGQLHRERVVLDPQPRDPNAFAAGAPVHRQCVIQLEALFRSVGGYVVELTNATGMQLGRFQFGVRLRPPP